MNGWIVVGGVLAGLVYMSRDLFASTGDATALPTSEPFAPLPVSDVSGDLGVVVERINADVPRGAGGADVTQGMVDFAQAIAHAEGFGIAGAIPTRANNPGDLVVPGWTGATLGREGISVFPDEGAGWRALYHQLDLIRSGRSHVYSVNMTINEMARRYTNTQQPEWANNVAAWLSDNGYPEVTPDSALAEILS